MHKMSSIEMERLNLHNIRLQNERKSIELNIKHQKIVDEAYKIRKLEDELKGVRKSQKNLEKNLEFERLKDQMDRYDLGVQQRQKEKAK